MKKSIPSVEDQLRAICDNTSEPFDVIHRYTRKQAVEDGTLVDLTANPETAKLVKEAGFTVPVAMTYSSFAKCVCAIGEELSNGQSVTGRLWDVLHMLRVAIKSSGNTNRITYKLRVRNGKKNRLETITLLSIMGGGDDGKPCITIMFPDEE